MVFLLKQLLRKKRNDLNLHDMKIYSNTPIPVAPIRWKDEEFFVAINHKENIVTEDNQGMRYEADFTVATGTDETSILQAFERHFNDAEHDQKVIDTIEIEGQKAISVIKQYPADSPRILSSEVLTDATLEKGSEILKALDSNADEHIKKLAGKVKNYIADLTEGVRTTATDQEVAQLILDGNIIITNE